MIATALWHANAFGADAGATGFNTNCSLCHQLAGQGLAGQFPRIAGRINSIATTPQGRKYLAALVLSGMSGTVTIDGAPIVGVMPSFAALSDTALADILNYALRLDKKAKAKARSFTPGEIAAVRKEAPVPPAGMHALRDAATPP